MNSLLQTPSYNVALFERVHKIAISISSTLASFICKRERNSSGEQYFSKRPKCSLPSGPAQVTHWCVFVFEISPRLLTCQQFTVKNAFINCNKSL